LRDGKASKSRLRGQFDKSFNMSVMMIKARVGIVASAAPPFAGCFSLFA
jgi:hypothetical protein